MDLMEKIRKELSDRKISVVAARTGIHENTLRAIASGKNQNPTLIVLGKLMEYLFGDKNEIS